MPIHGILADLPLGISPGLLIAQIVNFAILYFILARFVFPALRKTLDQRTNTIREGVENAERARIELAKAQQQSDAIILQAQQHGQQIIADATTAAERVRAQIEVEAKQRADEIAQQNRLRMQQEENQARAALRTQIADLAISAASQVVGESLDGPKQRRLVEEFVAEVK